MPSKQKITTHLWFDKEAKEAAQFYCSLFPDSAVTSINMIHDTPSGDCDIVSFKLSGQSFMAISAGPLFKFNPSVSFLVNFDPSKDANAEKNLDATWQKLSEGGFALMPLNEYPFSKRYGWIQDRYGLSWQLMLTDPSGEERPLILPFVMFSGNVAGKAEEASDYYMSVFKNSKRGTITRYAAGMPSGKEGSVMFTDFMLDKQWFAATDSAIEHKFAFNEAISFMVDCGSQDEIDYYWEKLSAVPEAEQCGWCKDKYGLSWQIVAAEFDEMMSKGTPEQNARVMKAFMKMKKFDLAELRRAYG